MRKINSCRLIFQTLQSPHDFLIFLIQIRPGKQKNYVFNFETNPKNNVFCSRYTFFSPKLLMLSQRANETNKIGHKQFPKTRTGLRSPSTSNRMQAKLQNSA